MMMMKRGSVPLLQSAMRRASMPRGNAPAGELLLIRVGRTVRQASSSATQFRPLSARNARRVLPAAPLSSPAKTSSSLALTGHNHAAEDTRESSTVTHSKQAPNGNEATQPKSDLVVVLDMDECLIHSKFFAAPFLSMAGGNISTAHYRQDEDGRPTNGFSQPQEGEEGEDTAAPGKNLFSPKVVDYFRFVLPDGDLVRVNKRPFVDEFLQRVSSKYETYVFTAAASEYACPVLDRLDPTNSMIRKRFYRESCTPHDGAYVKDLRNIFPRRGDDEVVFEQEQDFRRKVSSNGAPTTGSHEEEEASRLTLFDERRVVLVDNNPLSFLANPSNGILVSSFYDDPLDDTLWGVADLLDELDQEEDVRPVLDDMFGLRNALRWSVPQLTMPVREERAVSSER